MTQPHPDILRDPSRSIADIDGRRESAVNGIADLLEAVDDDVEDSASTGNPVMDVPILDRECPRADDPAEPAGDAGRYGPCPAATDTTRAFAREIEAEVTRPGWADRRRPSPVTYQPS